MSLTATWTAASWTAIGAATAAATRSISTNHLAETTRLTGAGAPRSPPTSGLVAGQVIATAVLFGLLAWRFGPRVELLAYSYLAVVAVPLSVIDMLEMRLPRSLVLPLYPVCGGLFGLAATVNGDGPAFVQAVAGMAVLLAAYLTTAVVSHGGLGAGDVRAAGPIGLALAWLSWSTLLAGTVFSLVLFAATAIATRDSTRSFLRQERPFGPAMFAGAFLAIAIPQPSM